MLNAALESVVVASSIVGIGQVSGRPAAIDCSGIVRSFTVTVIVSVIKVDSSLDAALNDSRLST